MYESKEIRLKSLEAWLKRRVGGQEPGYFSHSPIYRAYKYHGDDFWSDVKRLGYSEGDIRRHKPLGWWKKWENVEQLIKNFMKNTSQGRFPTQKEFSHVLGMSGKVYMFHGGILKMKEKMRYIEPNAVLDVLGRQHKSSYEAIFANLLIALGLSFTKETKIDHNHPYLCDYDLTEHYTICKRLLVEIWGYRKDEQGHNGHYNDKRQLKECVYKGQVQNIDLISLEEYHFNGTYVQIAKTLFRILSKYLPLEEIDFSSIDLIPRGKDYLTEEKMAELCRYFSPDGGITMPSSDEFVKVNYTLYSEIKRRFGTLEAFATKIGMEVVRVPPGYWSIERLFEAFESMYLTEGRYLVNTKEIRMNIEWKEKYEKLIYAADRNGGWKKCWELYFEDCLKKGKDVANPLIQKPFRKSSGWTLKELHDAFEEMYQQEGEYILNSGIIIKTPVLKDKYGRLITASKKNGLPGWKKSWDLFFLDRNQAQ